MMKYDQAYNGDRVFPALRNYKLGCCDCGLVHTLNFSVWRPVKGGYVRAKRHKISFVVTRDFRATAGRRRAAKIKRKIKKLKC